MKKRLLILTIILSLLLTSSCSNQTGNNKLKIGTYVEVINELAYVKLMEDNKYEFCRHIATSFVPSGKYVIEDGDLILKTGDNEDFRFEINGDKLIYKGGPHSEDLVRIGTVFQLTKKDI